MSIFLKEYFILNKMLILTIRSPHEELRKIPLVLEKTTLGRVSENDILIPDDSASRFHAEIYYHKGDQTLEIKDLDSGSWFSPEFSDQRICTLDQVIDAVRGKARLNIELKFSGHQQQLASEVVRILNENDFVDQCNLTSLDYRGILRARAADPDVRTGVIVTSAIGDITTLEAELLSIGTKAATRGLIARAQGKDLEIHVWTVNDVPTMNAMIGRGVDQVITDDPKLLGEVLAERAEMSTAEKLLLQFADFTSGR